MGSLPSRLSGPLRLSGYCDSWRLVSVAEGPGSARGRSSTGGRSGGAKAKTSGGARTSAPRAGRTGGTGASASGGRRDGGGRGVGHRPAVVRAVRRRRHRGVPGHQPPERAGPAERARRLATDGVGRLPEARTRERVVALPPERELLPELQARPGPEPLAAPEMVVAQRRGIRGAVAPPGAMAKGRAGPPARRARSGAVRFRAEHAPPRAAVPREPPVKPGVAAGRRLLTGPAGTRRPARSARPMMARAGPAGLPRAQARATAREPHPATGRAGPPGRPREVVSAARPRRQRADHVG